MLVAVHVPFKGVMRESVLPWVEHSIIIAGTTLPRCVEIGVKMSIVLINAATEIEGIVYQKIIMGLII